MSDHENEEIQDETIVTAFDRLCFAFGDQDAILPTGIPVDDSSSTKNTEVAPAVSYFEIEEYSKNLAYQLHWRLKPDYILVDCQRWTAAEAVATLACMRIGRPFVPVSCYDQHRPGRLNVVVDHLRKYGKDFAGTDSGKTAPSIVAVTVCDNDLDPILSVFQQAGVHQILYLDTSGNLQEQIPVPALLPPSSRGNSRTDELMVLFTSGTTGGEPKAVVGSHCATLRRIEWFQKTFSSSPRIARKTGLTFVDGVTELWSTLLDASSVFVTLPPSTLLAEGLAAILRYGQPTQLLLLPSQIGPLLLLPHCPSLTRLIVSGEQCSQVAVERFRVKYPTTQLVNLYGQTETSGDVLCAVLTDLDDSVAFVDNVVAVGTPIGDTVIELTSERQEVIVSGSQLSNGYLGPQQNDTEHNGKVKSFATGDIGFEKNGIYYVKGRIDDVVKLNGIWTCPVELEMAFARMYHADEVLACFVQGHAYLLCPNEKACQRFSRQAMHMEGGLPWNLIPQQVICSLIPRSQTGAPKADRREAATIVKNHLWGTSSRLVSTAPQRSEGSNASFSSILRDALNLPTNFPIDEKKSFVELGGDSAKAIAVLYQLRRLTSVAANLTAVDLLALDSISMLNSILNGDQTTPRKKQKRSLEVRKGILSFHPPSMVTRHSKNHISLKLQACVDSSALVLGDFIYAACQGGVVLKFTIDGNVLGCWQSTGWMIQADLIAANNESIVACAYKKDLSAGLVVALSLDLKQEKWRRVFNLPIKASPIVMDSILWVASGTTDHTLVHLLEVKTGEDYSVPIKLPLHSLSKPVEMGGNIYYGCSSWDGGLFAVNSKGEVQHLFQGEIGPINGRDLAIGGEKVLAADAYGAFHSISIKTASVETTWLTSVSLTTPTLRKDGVVVIGSNDGKLYALSDNDKVWECDCRTSIIGRPVCMKDGSTIVCTSAGHIILVSAGGSIVRQERLVTGEIWGDPAVISGDEGATVVVGARDSRIHLISINL